MSTLKPCPHCGSAVFPRVAPYQFPPDGEGGAWKWGFVVVCDASGIDSQPKGCGASSAWGETEDEARDAWNRRTPLPVTVSEPGRVSEEAVEAIEPYFERQIAWSRSTFGPALRTGGILDHISKELKEIAANPHDLSEWIDVVILAMDGFWQRPLVWTEQQKTRPYRKRMARPQPRHLHFQPNHPRIAVRQPLDRWPAAPPCDRMLPQ